tara:strand:+ start:374 stop:718 length:345 start_codon:yes stop_codon:yes gene_type:complete
MICGELLTPRLYSNSTSLETQREKAQVLVKEGKAFYEKKSYDEAFGKLEDALKIYTEIGDKGSMIIVNTLIVGLHDQLGETEGGHDRVRRYAAVETQDISGVFGSAQYFIPCPD